MTDYFEKLRVEWLEAAQCFSEFSADLEALAVIESFAATSSAGLQAGGAVFFAGNGGSFADSQHMAAELTGKMNRMRRSIAGLALGTNSSSMSAIGNDFGFDYVFAREFQGLFRPNSVVFAMSTSGNSRNVVELAIAAKDLGSPMLCLTGDQGGEVEKYCEVVSVPSSRTERVQEVHTLIGHSYCFLIEEMMGLTGDSAS